MIALNGNVIWIMFVRKWDNRIFKYLYIDIRKLYDNACIQCNTKKSAAHKLIILNSYSYSKGLKYNALNATFITFRLIKSSQPLVVPGQEQGGQLHPVLSYLSLYEKKQTRWTTFRTYQVHHSYFKVTFNIHHAKPTFSCFWRILNITTPGLCGPSSIQSQFSCFFFWIYICLLFSVCFFCCPWTCLSNCQLIISRHTGFDWMLFTTSTKDWIHQFVMTQALKNWHVGRIVCIKIIHGFKTIFVSM